MIEPLTREQRQELERCLTLAYGVDESDCLRDRLNDTHEIVVEAMKHWGKSQERLRNKAGSVTHRIQKRS
jgi:hypothetical protein